MASQPFFPMNMTNEVRFPPIQLLDSNWSRMIENRENVDLRVLDQESHYIIFPSSSTENQYAKYN